MGENMKRVFILASEDFFGIFCRQAEELLISIDSPIPQDAIFVGAKFSFERNCFMIAFEHDSFEDVPQGAEIPILECPKITKHEILSCVDKGV